MTIQTKAVEYSQEDTTFEGYFAWNDAASAPSPCVLVSHAWGGAGEFEQAALDAVSSYRYEPYVLDGQAYERLLAVRVRFALQ